MDGVTNKLAGNKTCRWYVYKGKKDRNDKGIPNFYWIRRIPIMDQAENEHTPLIQSDDEAEFFHRSEMKDNITVYY